MKKEFVAAAMLVATSAWAAAADTGKGSAPGSTDPNHGAKTRNVAIVLYDGVEILDFAGPSEVFASAGNIAGAPGTPAYHVYTMAATKAPVKSQGFISVTPEFSIDDAPQPDIIVIPGGQSGNLTSDARFMAWVKPAIDRSELTLTVCSGAFVAAKAGVLDGRPATTWYGSVERLKKDFPKVDAQDGRRFVDSGKIVTTAGVSAGIDGALHVVARLTGRNTADRTARYMEYHWTPEPYLATGYSYLNPTLNANGRAMQQVSLLETEGRFDEAVPAWRAYLEKNPSEAAAWYHLGVSLHSLKRFDEAAGAGEKSAALSPSIRPDALYLVACARAQQGKKAEALTALEQSIAAGFAAKGALEHDTDFDPLRGEARFQALVARL
ncbi:MAG TPA: DJ-1/PfpI family protein [Candidatus Polarisedimenticolia bacterium]|nr:DJ-1/PfpI family protein [Candidatus Polarisedimenticolia bacterium]